MAQTLLQSPPIGLPWVGSLFNRQNQPDFDLPFIRVKPDLEDNILQLPF